MEAKRQAWLAHQCPSERCHSRTSGDHLGQIPEGRHSSHSTNAYCIQKCTRSDQLVTIVNAIPHWLSILQVRIQGIIFNH